MGQSVFVLFAWQMQDSSVLFLRANDFACNIFL